MKYLLDTHVYLWWLSNDKKLTPSVKKIISTSNNIIFVSVVSFWEISIKFRAKKLSLQTSFYSLYENLQFTPLSVTIEHVLAIDALPSHHKDPFDRMLIAQAIVEKCVIITNDSKINRYKISTLG